MFTFIRENTRLRRTAKFAALSGLLAVIAAIAAYEFVYENRGIDFFAARPQLIWNCLLSALVAGILIQAIYRPGAWGAGRQLTRPVRLVILTWSLAVLLCIALAPVADFSGPRFVLLGAICSLPVVVIGVGLALSARCRRNNLLLLAAAGTPFLTVAAFTVVFSVCQPIEYEAEIEIISWSFRVAESLLGLTAIALEVLSMRGWIAFYRGGAGEPFAEPQGAAKDEKFSSPKFGELL